MRINVGLVTEVIISPDIDPGEILKLLRFDFVSEETVTEENHRL